MIKNFFIKLGTSTALEVIGMSYWICLYVCMFAIILYMAGQKKAGRVASISFAINFLLQALKLGLK